MNRKVVVLLLLIGVIVSTPPLIVSAWEKPIIQSTYGVPVIDGMVSAGEWPHWTTIQIPIDDAFTPNPPSSQDVPVSAQNTAALLTIAAQVHNTPETGRHSFNVRFFVPGAIIDYILTRESDGSVYDTVLIDIWSGMGLEDSTRPYGNASFRATEPDGNGTYSFEMGFPITLAPRVEGSTDIQGLRPSSSYEVYFSYSNSIVGLYSNIGYNVVCAVDPLQVLIFTIIIVVPTTLLAIFVWRRLKRRRRRKWEQGQD